MSAMRPPAVLEAEQFQPLRDALLAKYEELEEVLDGLRQVLVMDYALPHVPVSVKDWPGVYAVKLDYPPEGSSGVGKFLLTYHQSKRAPSMSAPLCTYTFLTITELD